MASDILIDAKAVERVFRENEICFTGCTPVGDAIADEDNGIVSLPVRLDKCLLACSTETTFLVGVGERDLDPFFLLKIGMVGVERDVREMVNL